jgi:tRNA-Thr(GGU) m(6)t(6)A37 methyltransferase TsaA
MVITCSPIGVIRSSFKDPQAGGRQATIDGREGTIIVHEELAKGLEGIGEFSHIIALYHFHRQTEVHLKACPCFDPSTEHGIFASRYPTRPNHIGISVWTLQQVKDNVLFCRDIDVLDGTPLLDIKPYVKQFDQMDNPKCGWYDVVDWRSVSTLEPTSDLKVANEM